MNDLTIVIPAKNEEKRISKTLSSYGRYLKARQKNLKAEIIVVVNDTDDETPRIIDSFSEKYPFIKRVQTHYSSGKGGAVALGFHEANSHFIGYVDADGAVPISEIHRLYDLLSDAPEIDGVVGTRSRSKTKMSLKRRFISGFYNIWVKLLFDLNYKDTQCAAKIFKRDVAKSIGRKLSKTGWAFDVNLLLLAKYMNYLLIEKEVSWSEREGSKFSLKEAFFELPLELLSLKKMHIGYKYNEILSKFWDPDLKQKIEGGVSNILIFAWRDIKHPEMGGSEIYVHQVAKRLAKTNRVTLFTSKPGNLSSFDVIDDVRIIRKGNRFTVYLWAFIYYVRYLGKKTDYVIDVQNGIPFFTALYSGKPKLMLLHHVHKKQWFKEFPFPVAIIGYALEAYLMPFLYNNVPVITVSPSSKQELNSIGFPDRLLYLGYNSIPPKVGRTYKESKNPLLIYVGRIKAYKQLETAIITLKELKKKHPNLKLIIAGAGDHLDNLKDLAERLNVTDSILFTGFISEKKKWELLQKAWVFLMPSMKEGWGITIIEAASCGTPTVGFDVLGVRDSIKHGNTGLLSENIDEYIENVDLLLSNRRLRKKLGTNAITWSMLFSWDTTTNVFLDVISKTNENHKLLSDKLHPWEVDLATENLSTLMNIK